MIFFCTLAIGIVQPKPVNTTTRDRSRLSYNFPSRFRMHICHKMKHLYDFDRSSIFLRSAGPIFSSIIAFHVVKHPKLNRVMKGGEIIL